MDESQVAINWNALMGFFSPMFVIALSGLALFLHSALSEDEDSKIPFAIALAGLIVAFVLAWNLWPGAKGVGNLFATDKFAVFGFLILMLVAAFACVGSLMYLKSRPSRKAIHFGLILMSLFGFGLEVAASSLVTILPGLAIAVISLGTLIAWSGGKSQHTQGSVKYFAMSVFAVAFFIMGVVFIFGSAGTVEFATLALRAREIAAGDDSKFFVFGIAMTTIGFGFFAAAVPFHTWAEDADVATPWPVSAFAVVASIVAALIAFSRFALSIAPAGSVSWHHLICALALFTMLIGNLAAARQEGLRRIIFSLTIAQAGCLLVAIPSISANPKGSLESVFLGLTAFAVSTIGVFASVAALEPEGCKDLDISDLAGLGRARPLLSAVFSLFLLSIAGLPPTIGFFGRYYVFFQAMKGGDIWFVLLALLVSVLSVWCSVRLLAVMYFHRRAEVGFGTIPPSLAAIILIAALVVFVFGIVPQNLIAFVQSSAI